MITQQQLAIFTGPQIAGKYYDVLIAGMAKYNINTKLRVCAFLAQILHESFNLLYSKELTGHTSKTMMSTWKKIFPTVESTVPYLHNPVALFNYVYGRPGNDLGNTQTGDGWKYIGRGFIGVTGRFNYTALAKDTGMDFVNHPELLELPQYAFLSAFNFWDKYKLNLLADHEDIVGISHKVNGGSIGLQNRIDNYNELIKMVA